jgi:UDPglucose 6-dehydrogenase
VADVAKGIGLDSRIGPQFLSAGLGWGGSCFPKDVQGLVKTSERYGYDFELLQAVIDINSEQTAHFVKRLENRLDGFKGKRIALMGLAFKPNTDDIRDAKSLEIIEMVLAAGGTVSAYDPIAAENVQKIYPNIDYARSVYDVTDEADAVIVVTEWNEFRQLDLARLGACMRQKVMFDGRRLYKREAAERHGFEYFTIGG